MPTTDPWAVVSVGAPAAGAAGNGAAPPPPSAPKDPWAVTHVNDQPVAPSGPSAAPGGEAPDNAPDLYSGAIQNVLGGLYGLHGIAGLMGAGAVKEGTSSLGHLVNFVTKSHGDQPIDPNTMRGHVNDAAQWLVKGSEPQGVWENVGAIGEQMAEYMSGEGLLKLAGKLPAVAGGVETVKNLESAQKIAKFLSEHKVMGGLAAIGLKAVQEGTIQAGQTYAHTGDTGQAVGAGVLGGVLGGGAASLAEGGKALRGVRNAAEATRTAEAATAAAEAEKGKPITIDVGGTPVTVLREQVTPEGKLTGVTATGQGRADVAAEQQQQLQNILENKAQTGIGGTLTRANNARGMTFERGALEPEYIKVGEGPTAGWAEKKPPGAYGTAASTKDPLEAERWLGEIDSMQRDPLISDQAHGQLEEMRQSIEGQLGLHRASSRIGPIDVPGALQNVRSFGDAGAQAHGAARDLYQMMDDVSEGQFNKLRDAEKSAQSVLWNPNSSAEAVDKAQNDLEEIQGKVNDLFDTHADQITPGDAQAARDLYREGIAYNQLHALVERMANGITLGETESGLPRVVAGNNKLFEGFLSKGRNREVVTKLIGEGGIEDLKTMFQLTRDANVARKTAKVMDNVTKDPEVQKTLLQRLNSFPWGRALLMGHVGGTLAGATPMGYSTGAALTTAAVITPQISRFLVRHLLENAAANGRAVKMIDFAVQHDLDPRIYAPLIARAIMVPFQEQPKEEEQK